MLLQIRFKNNFFFRQIQFKDLGLKVANLWLTTVEIDTSRLETSKPIKQESALVASYQTVAKELDNPKLPVAAVYSSSTSNNLFNRHI